MKRFNDNQQTIYDFGNCFLIHCPQCNNRAEVITTKDKPGLFCNSCGLNKEWKGNNSVSSFDNTSNEENRCITIDGPFDWYFHERLWLQTNCCNTILYAYNKEHLFFLKEYVSATLRERRNIIDNAAKNSTLASRLPKWMINRKNREQIIKKIQELEKLLW